MQSRGPEQNHLTIEAIIQKSEYANNKLGMIPTDIKKLFMNELITNNGTKNQTKRSGNFYMQTKRQGNNFSHHQSKHIPPLPPRSEKSKSLNTSKEHKLEGIKSTRAEKSKNKKPIQLICTRHSLSQAIPGYRNTISTEDVQKQKGIHVSQDQFTLHRPLVPFKSTSDRNLGRQASLENPKIINRIQYQFIPPPQPKYKKHQSFRKTEQNFDISDKKDDNQAKLFQKSPRSIKKQSSGTSFYRKKFRTSIEVIPDFVMAAIEGQISQKTINPSEKLDSLQEFEKNKKIKQFNFDNVHKNECSPKAEHRQAKQSNCVLQMKKKIEFHKTRRTEESVEDVLEPKVEFLKLAKKSEYTQQSSEMLAKQKEKRKRTMTYKKPAKKRAVIEEDVCGWQINQGPMFQDYY